MRELAHLVPNERNHPLFGEFHMSIRNLILGGACALALSAVASGAALAGFAGTISGDYGNLHASGGGSADSWGGNVQGMFGVGPGWSVEVDGGYHNISASGLNLDNWTVSGDAIWTGTKGRLAAQVGYDDTSGAGSLHATNYGLVGEWWAQPSFTVSGKGGAFSGSGGGDGYYLGGALTGYIHDNFALSGGIDYTHLNHAGNETDYTAQGEWLISETTPISVFGGYTYSDISGFGGHIDTWFVGLRFYTDGPGPMTLNDRQHQGALLPTDNFGPTILKF